MLFLLILIPLLLILMAVGTYMFLVQPNLIAGNSMMPTYQNGAYVLTNKLAYRLTLPARGDVIIFHKPNAAESFGVDYISRIIGLPGEKIRIAQGKVYINGSLLGEPYVFPEAKTLARVGEYELFTEGVDNTIPDFNYVVLGDNREHSTDSRYFGLVPKSYILGKIFACVANCQPPEN